MVLAGGIDLNACPRPGDCRRTRPIPLSRHSDGVRFTFSVEEWQDLKSLFSATLAEPSLQTVFHELSLVYGEL